VNAPIVSGGVITTTPVINNPYGGAFRNNSPSGRGGECGPFLHTGDASSF